MKIRENLSEIKQGFHRSFWVANGMELFERLAYYGQGTVLMVFLTERLSFAPTQAGLLQSIFGGLFYFLPIFAGTIADRIGFRKAFMIAFGVLGVGYFLIGSTGMDALRGVYGDFPIFWVLVSIVAFTAMGGSFIKPSVLGTVAVTSKPNVKSLGYAIYYWLVNIGAAIGPYLAYLVNRNAGIEFVYIVSSTSCFLMLFATIFFFKDVKGDTPVPTETLMKKIENLFLVLANAKFMIFLLIFSLFWIMFWQIFIVVPIYIRQHISEEAPFEIISSMGAWAIIVLQLIVNRLTRHIATRSAIVIGFGVASLCWLIIGLQPTVFTMIAGIVVFSIGEMTQAPRYYEYISELAPPGQQGLFQGYAFLPIAIGWAVGGVFGGWLYESFAKPGTPNPQYIWFVFFVIGILATSLMYIYNKVVSRMEREA